MQPGGVSASNSSGLGGAGPGRLPGIAAHLRACGPCKEDFVGLVAALGGNAS
jgi:hypothetical protein